MDSSRLLTDRTGEAGASAGSHLVVGELRDQAGVGHLSTCMPGEEDGVQTSSADVTGLSR